MDLVDNSPPLEFSSKVSSLGTLMGKLEGNGLFIKKIIFQYSFTCFAIALPLYGLGYLTSVPKVTCLQPDGSYAPTLPSDACKKRGECHFTYEIDNWNKRYDLVCDREALKDFSVSLMFWILSFGSLMVASLVDFLGRKAVIQIGSIVYLASAPAIYFIDQFQAKMVIFGIMASFDTNMMSSNSILVREISSEGSIYNSYVLNFGFAFYSLASVANGLFTLGVKSGNMMWLSFIGVFCFALVGNFFFYEESPIIYYRKKKLDPLLRTLGNIAKGNGVSVEKAELVDDIRKIEQQAEENAKETSDDGKGSDLVRSLTKNEVASIALSPGSESTSSLTKNTIGQDLVPAQDATEIAPKKANFILVVSVLAIHSIAVNTLFLGLAISIDSCGFESIQLNAILLGVSSMVGYYYSSLLEVFPRIKTISVIYGSVVMSTLINYILSAYVPQYVFVKIIRSLLSIVVINLLVCGAFCNYYLYAGEALEPTRRGVGIGLANCCGKLIGSLSTFVKTYCNNHGIDPIIGFTIPCIFAIIAFQFVPETRPRPSKNKK